MKLPFSLTNFSILHSHPVPIQRFPMEGTKANQNTSPKNHQFFVAAQICLRVMATAATLAAACIVFTNKQTVVVFGMLVDARYSYSSAFKFFAIANFTGASISALSMFATLILGNKSLDAKRYFYMFLSDLILTTLLMAGCAAATAIAYVGKYGNSHAGWMEICDNFAKFCDRVAVSLILSYFGVILYMSLTIISANKSRQLQV